MLRKAKVDVVGISNHAPLILLAMHKEEMMKIFNMARIFSSRSPEKLPSISQWPSTRISSGKYLRLQKHQKIEHESTVYGSTCWRSSLHSRTKLRKEVYKCRFASLSHIHGRYYPERTVNGTILYFEQMIMTRPERRQKNCIC